MGAAERHAPDAAPSKVTLVCRARARLCALPIEAVVETMRPLPVSELPGAPPFVRGVSLIRGSPVPVVDVGGLLGDLGSAGTTRFVLLRLGERRVALALEEVLGLRELPAQQLGELPPLLRDASEVVPRVAALDSELLHVLAAARLVPDSVWQAPQGEGGK
ncbi:MAG: chemotaxis protein CheW [Vicinamibacteria bacterium]